MKKIFFISIILLIASCQEQDIKGYVVYKKHIPKHMCHDEDVKIVTEAGMTPIVVPHTTHTHHHSEQAPTWEIYVSNSYGTTKVSVTENCYNSFHVTDKVHVYGNHVELIKKGCR
ncbi:MAG: hypothetical protein RIR01_2314 [Bacteroidota bacterium]|jgi:hypothetical protein